MSMCHSKYDLIMIHHYFLLSIKDLISWPLVVIKI
jgi:hypothetical protein